MAMDTLDPEAITPTGLYAPDRENTDPRVRDYNADQIAHFVLHSGRIASWPLARLFAEWFDRDLLDWDEGTDHVTTWESLIDAGIETFVGGNFPRLSVSSE